LKRADEIGISIGTGLSHVRHRSENFIDKKSKPKDDMPDWWISSNWVPPESSEEDEEDNSLSDHNNDNDNDNDNNNNNGNNNGSAGGTSSITALG
jgi:hypothetical protein